MNTEELLKPRYKVIADYPGLKFNIGRVLTPIKEGSNYFNCTDAPSSEVIGFPNKYPHLFKELFWWEDRNLEDLPEYIRFGELDKRHAIYKIISWNTLGEDFKSHEPCGYAERPSEYFISLQFPNNFPSTQEEYEQSLVTNS